MTILVEKKEQIDFDRSVDYSPAETSRDFSMHGERKDVNKIFLKLRIADSMGKFYTFVPLVFASNLEEKLLYWSCHIFS